MKAMKKVAITLLSVLMCLLACFSLFACGDKGDGGNGGGTGSGTGGGGTTPTPPPVVITVGEVSGTFTYNGEAHEPTLSVTKDETALVKGTDYDLTYANNINAGTASVTVDFKGEYAEETDVTKNFTIAPKAVTPIVELASGTYTYNGSAHTPAVTVKDGGEELEATDFEVAYANNVNAGTATVTVTLKGNYAGTKAEEFAIARAKVAKPEGDDTVFTFNGQAQTYEIAENAGYTITGATETNAGAYTVTVALNANYEWADETRDDLTFDFAIARAKIAKPVADDTVFTYNAQEQTYTLAENAGYTISGGLTATNAGTKTITVALNANYEWMDGTRDNATYDFVINPFDASAAEVTVNDVVWGDQPTLAGLTIDGFTFSEFDYEEVIDFGDITTTGDKTATVTFRSNFTGTATGDYKVLSIHEVSRIYMDLNGQFYDTAGEPSVISAYGTPDFTSNLGSVKVTEHVNYFSVADAQFGADDFTLSFDLKMSEATFTNPDNYANKYEIFYSEADASLGRANSHSAFQFSWRSDKNGFRIAVGANSNGFYFDNIKDKMTFDDWMTITLVVDRMAGTEAGKTMSSAQYGEYAAEEKANILLYIDGVLAGSKTYYLPTGQEIGNGILKVAQGDSTPNKEYELDNIYVINRALSAGSVEKIPANSAVESAKNMWRNNTGDINFDFTAGASENYVVNLALEKLATDALFENVTFSSNIASYVATAPTVEGNVASYALTIPKADWELFKDGVTASVTANGIEKKFLITYVALETLYADMSAIEMWNDEKTGDTYNFSVGIYADDAKTIVVSPDTGVTLTASGVAGMTFTYNNGKYDVALPATAVEKLGTQTITIAVDGNTAVTVATFTFTHKYIDDATVAKLVENTQTYLAFEDNLVDMASSKEAKMVLGTAIYEEGVNGKAIKLNSKNKTAKIDGVVLGANSFTISFDAKISATNYPSDANYNEFVGSMDPNQSQFRNDYPASTFQVTYRSDRGIRFAVGRNGEFGATGGDHYAGRKGPKTADKWFRYTIVVERDIETVAGRTKAINGYDNQGNNKDELGNTQSGGEFNAEETARITWYADGVQFYTTLVHYSTDQYIGQDALWLGGQFTELGYTHPKDNDFWMDNFVVYSGAMTADEVRGMTSANSSYYADLIQKGGFDVADMNYDFTDKDELLENGAEVEFVNYGKTDLTGATITGLSQGMTFVENAGVYTLEFESEEVLDACANGVELTLTLGEVSRKFTFTYAPLAAIYAEKSAVEMWADQKTGDNYVFDMNIYLNESKTTALTADMGLTPVIEGVLNATIAYGTNSWVVTLPASEVENKEAQTLTISIEEKDSVTPATFTFAHKFLDATALDKLVAGTETYLSFNDNLINTASDKTATMALGGTATYVDGIDGKAIKLNPANKVVKIAGQEIGTTSFTFSFDVKLTAMADSPLNAQPGKGVYDNYYQLVASGGSYEKSTHGNAVDAHPAMFQLSYRGNRNVIRGQVGRNGGGQSDYLSGSNSDSNLTNYTVVKPGTWQRITMVVERNVAIEEGHTSDHTYNSAWGGSYDENGNYVQGSTWSGNINTPEKATWKFYVDAKLIKESTVYYSANQSIGFGDLFLGGDYGIMYSATRNADFLMDNFVFYRGAMTADEVRGMTSVNSSYYANLIQKGGFDVADVAFDYTEVTSATEHIAPIEIINAGKTDLTGATLKEEVAGIELVENEGAYELHFDATGLADAKDGVNLTLVIGGMERAFTVTYTALEALYTADLTLLEPEKVSGDAVVRTIKVTADEAGTVPVENVTFGEGIELIEEKGDGLYEIKVPYAVANYAMNHTALADAYEVKVVKTIGAIVNHISEPNYVSTRSTYHAKNNASPDLQGGKVFEVGKDAFNTGSFTLSMQVSGLDRMTASSIGASGSGMLFSNSNTDAYEGFTLYADGDGGGRFRFRTGNGDYNGTKGTGKNGSANVNYAFPAGYSILTITFDRTVENKVTYTVYFNGSRIGSAVYNIGANPDFDTTGHVVVGSPNVAYENVAAALCNNNEFNLTIGSVLILNDIADYAMCESIIKSKTPVIEALYTDVTDRALWGDEKKGDNFVFTTNIYTDSAKKNKLAGGINGYTPVISGVEGATITYNASSYNWTISVPASAIGQEAKTLSVGLEGKTLTPATFALTLKTLDEATLTKLVNGTEVYMNFNDNINDLAGGKATSMALGSAPTYVDGVDGKAITLNPKTNVLKIAGESLGTTSFTMSFDFNVVAEGATTLQNNFELVASKYYTTAYGDNDGHPSTFTFAYRGQRNILRLQAGRNDGTAIYMAGNNWGSASDYTALKPGTWQRVTVVVERGIVAEGELATKTSANYNNDGNFSEGANGVYAVPEIMNYHFYLDGKLWKSYTDIQSSNQTLGFGDLYLGGDYNVFSSRDNNNHNFSMDNFVVYRGAMTADEVRFMSSANSDYYEQVVEKKGFKVADVNFDFSEMTSVDGHMVDLEFVNYGGTVPTGATLVAEEGFELIEEGGVYKLAIDATGLEKAESGQTLTIDFAGVQKSFTVTYAPLAAIYAEKSAVEMWGDQKTGDNYVFNMNIFLNETKTYALTPDMGLTPVISGAEGATIAYVTNTWVVTLPAAQVENQAAKTFTISLDGEDGVTPVSFTFTHKYLDEATLTKLVDGTEAYLNFEDNITELASGKATSMAKGDTAIYADGVDGKAITLNTKTSTVLLDGVDLGTTSFTMSFDVNVDGSTVSGNNNEFVSSLWAEDPDGWGYDRSPATFQMTYRADNKVRIAVGRNGGVEDHYAYNQLVANSWQRYTLVVERNVAFDESAEYPESATISLYRNANLVYSKTATYAEAQKIGFDKLYLGGHYSLLKNNWMTDNNFLMDNFVLYRGAMTQDEVRGMTSANSDYYARVAQKNVQAQ